MLGVLQGKVTACRMDVHLRKLVRLQYARLWSSDETMLKHKRFQNYLNRSKYTLN